jgi:predicted membrane-bound mannosyltransferase
MSFTDRLILWLHIGFAIFAIGPVTIAVMTTPRYIRRRNLVVLRYLYRTTFIYAVGCLGVLIAGLVLADLLHDFSKPWLTVSMTLFIVALVLLALVILDQHRAIARIEDAEETAGEVGAVVPAVAREGEAAEGADDSPQTGHPDEVRQAAEAAHASHIGHVERGRIVSLGGVISLIWLVILVLMIWK